MTEQNQERNPAPGQEPEQASDPGAPLEAGAATPTPADAAWPALPSELAQDKPGKPALVQDGAVNAVLDRLAGLRQTPVSGHGELYEGMHDALLEALNEDVTGYASVARRVHAAGDGGS